MKIVDTKMNVSQSGSTPGVRVNRTGRRTFTSAYKRAVVQECEEPGVSVAGVAMSHRINANLVRCWIVRQRQTMCATLAASPAVLLPVSVQRIVPTAEAPGDDGVSPAMKPRRVGAVIEIELYGARIQLRGGVDAQALAAVLDVLSRR